VTFTNKNVGVAFTRTNVFIIPLTTRFSIDRPYHQATHEKYTSDGIIIAIKEREIFAL
jgi:hypothetical protein